MALSTAFRTPTLLSSTDRQLGQRAENTSRPGLGGAAGRRRHGIAERLAGDRDLRLIATGAIVAAGFARGVDLLRRPQIRF
jgi:hypothetical protein